MRELLQKMKLVAPAAAIGYLMSFAFLAIAGRILGPSEFAKFSIFWGSFFVLGSIVGVIDLESARQFSVSRREKGTSRSIFVATIYFTLVIIISALILNSRSSILGNTNSLLLICGVGLLSLIGITRGALVSIGSSRDYSAELILEGLIRLSGIALLIKLDSVNEQNLRVVTVLGLLACFPFVHLLARASGVDSLTSTLRNLLALVAANAGAALVITAPVALIGIYAHGNSEEIGGLIAAVTISRVPLMATALIQPLLIPFFVTNESESSISVKESRRKIAIVVGGSTGLLTIFGPAIVSIFFGESYLVSYVAMFCLTLGSWALGVATILGSLLISMNKHRAYGVSWITGGMLMIGLFVGTKPNALNASVICLISSLAAFLLLAMFSKK